MGGGVQGRRRAVPRAGADDGSRAAPRREGPAPSVVVCLAAAALVWVTVTAGAQAQEGARESKRSIGIVVAMDVGLQNLIGGSLVSGVDVLSQARRPVGTVSVGVRAQAGFGGVVGFDLGLGITRGNLTQEAPDQSYHVSYANRTQRHWNVMLGQALGADRSTTVFAYLSEVSRAFEVLVDEGGQSYRQRDEQGLLRFGLGVERDLTRLVSVRASAGTSRADFGGRPTNLTPRRMMEVTLGAVVRP